MSWPASAQATFESGCPCWLPALQYRPFDWLQWFFSRTRIFPLNHSPPASHHLAKTHHASTPTARLRVFAYSQVSLISLTSHRHPQYPHFSTHLTITYFQVVTYHWTVEDAPSLATQFPSLSPHQPPSNLLSTSQFPSLSPDNPTLTYSLPSPQIF